MSDYEPLYHPGRSHTRATTAAVTGGQLLMVTGSGTVGPASAATVAWLGVAAFDAPSGGIVGVFAEAVQRLVASGSITAGQNVDAATGGEVQAHTNGTNDYTIVGLALTTAVDGGLVEVSMKR